MAFSSFINWTATSETQVLVMMSPRQVRFYFTTEQLEGSGEGILLAHTSNNIQQESMVSPVQQL